MTAAVTGVDTSTAAGAREYARQAAGFVAAALNADRRAGGMPDDGQTWTVDTDPRWSDYAGVYVDGPDTARLFVRLEWNNTDRLTVSGQYPDGARDVYPSAEHFTITVKRDRDPAAIAREIVRRLLPRYLPELARIRERITANTAAADRQAASVAAMVSAGGRYASGNHPSRPDRAAMFDLYNNADGTPYVSVEFRANHDGSGFTIDRTGVLPAPLVLRMVEMIRDYVDGGGER